MTEDTGLTAYQWITLGLGCTGFIGTWILGAFKLGRAVEQVKSSLKEEIDAERAKIFLKIDELESKFQTEQRVQDHNFGEVGAAMRQYIADVEKEVRKIEIYGRDNYVKKDEFEKATDSIRSDIKTLGSEIKNDIKDLRAQLVGKIV